MICICPEHYLKYSVKKLDAGDLGPFPIIRPLGSNAHLINFLTHTNINPTFLSIEDLTLHQGIFEPPPPSLSISKRKQLPKVPSSLQPQEDIEASLEDHWFLLLMVALAVI